MVGARGGPIRIPRAPVVASKKVGLGWVDLEGPVIPCPKTVHVQHCSPHPHCLLPRRGRSGTTEVSGQVARAVKNSTWGALTTLGAAEGAGAEGDRWETGDAIRVESAGGVISSERLWIFYMYFLCRFYAMFLFLLVIFGGRN